MPAVQHASLTIGFVPDLGILCARAHGIKGIAHLCQLLALKGMHHLTSSHVKSPGQGAHSACHMTGWAGRSAACCTAAVAGKPYRAA